MQTFRLRIVKAMRIALLAPVWGLRGGWSRVVEKMTPLIADRVKVTLYLPIDSPRRIGDFNFNVKYILPPISYHPLHPNVIKHTICFLQDLRKGGYDILQTYDSWPLSFLGALGSKILKIPLFVGAHGTAAINPLFNRKIRQSLIWSYKVAEKVFCISSFTKAMLEKLTGLSKFCILPLDGVDYEFFAKPGRWLKHKDSSASCGRSPGKSPPKDGTFFAVWLWQRAETNPGGVNHEPYPGDVRGICWSVE